MEQAKEAGGGERGCFGLVSSLSRPGEKVRVWHPESGSLSSLGNALTGKERQQHTRSGQTLRRKKQLAPEGRPEWSPAARGCHLLEEGLQARISRPGLRCLLPRGRRPPPGSAGSSPGPIWAVLAPEHKDPLCPGSPAAFWFLVTLAPVLCTADPPWALTRSPSKNKPAAKGLGCGVGVPRPRARRPRRGAGTASLSTPAARSAAGARNRGRPGAAGSALPPPLPEPEIGRAKPRARCSRDREPPPRARPGESGTRLPPGSQRRFSRSPCWDLEQQRSDRRDNCRVQGRIPGRSGPRAPRSSRMKEAAAGARGPRGPAWPQSRGEPSARPSLPGQLSPD